MIELIVMLIVLGVYFYIIVYGSVFFVATVAYGYWGLSIGMPPILWLFIVIGVVAGFFVAFKNAVKAAKTLRKKE